MSLLHHLSTPVWTEYWGELWTKVTVEHLSVIKITDLVFTDDAIIFAESLEILVMALEALHKEAKPLEL